MMPRMYTQEQRSQFLVLFGTQLRPYWHNLLGFDLFKFEDDFKLDEVPGKSLAEQVEKKYGAEALALIKELLTI